MGQHRTLVHLFPSFQKHITIFTTNKCENPYSIQCQDSNSQRLEHKSPPITTRPGLPPLVERMFTFKILALSIPPKGNSSSNEVLLYRLRSSDARALFSFSFFLRSPSLSLSLSLSRLTRGRPRCNEQNRVRDVPFAFGPHQQPPKTDLRQFCKKSFFDESVF